MIPILCFGCGLSAGALIRNMILGLALALEKSPSAAGASALAWSAAVWSYVPLVLLSAWLVWGFFRRTREVTPERRRALRAAGGAFGILSVGVGLATLAWVLVGTVVTGATGTGGLEGAGHFAWTTAAGLACSSCPFVLAGKVK